MRGFNIGLFGFGTVGQGVYDILKDLNYSKLGTIQKICVKDPVKSRKISKENFVYNKEEILLDEKIDVIIETIDDPEEAFKIVKTALDHKKHVITANKKMLAYHLKELTNIAKTQGVAFLYEASSCGSIPIIRLLDNFYTIDELLYVGGIFNGTTNYILHKIDEENLIFQTALKQAQEKGFAESDPTNDIEGLDSLYKLIIITYHAYGIMLDVKKVPLLGISTLNDIDIKFAKKHHLKIRLVAYSGIKNNQYVAFVLPIFVNKNSPLYHTEYEYNAVVLESRYSSQQFLKGKGAGSYPTASSIIADLQSIANNYKYRNHKESTVNIGTIDFDKDIKFVVYLRKNVLSDNILINWEKRYVLDNQEFGIANVNLKELKKITEEIRKSNGFIALWNDPWNRKNTHLENHIEQVKEVNQIEI
ncbi:MAG: homoserine dehydrogenase [Bacteroidia bacterium]|nr:MAG: homoserine dehydrogenase [Bacteroidia bacterium]